MCVDNEENELETLETIHHFVEVLDKYFTNVRHCAEGILTGPVQAERRPHPMLSMFGASDTSKSLPAVARYSSHACRLAGLQACHGGLQRGPRSSSSLEGSSAGFLALCCMAGL